MQFYQTDIIPILQNLRKCIYQDTDIITSNNNIGKTKLPPTYYIKNYNYVLLLLQFQLFLLN